MKVRTKQEAIDIIKGNLPYIDATPADKRNAWQFLVDQGSVWDMGTWWSNMAACQIAAGTLERNAA